MKKFTLLLLIGVFALVAKVSAQDEEDKSLKISGSVDTYYKYDFSGESQIPTSFATGQNSLGIGMVDVILEQTVGKASFVGEIAFGPRADASAPGAVQNLYVSYAFSDMISVTGGFMGTFVGYEVISPVGNFNYSTSYLFSNGPFQNGGLKFDFAISDRFAFMVGAFNEFDSYFNTSGGLDIGGQVYFMPIEGWDAYLNFVTSNDSGTEIDLTTTYQATDDFMVGFNVAKRTVALLFNEDENDGGGVNFWGAATYLNYSLSDAVALGLRYEYFEDDAGSVFSVPDTNTAVNAFTLSANIGSGPLVLIPEFRVDLASEDIFQDSDQNPTDIAGQVVVAAYYAF